MPLRYIILAVLALGCLTLQVIAAAEPESDIDEKEPCEGAGCEEFEVTLEKATGQQLGMKTKIQRSSLLVSAINDGIVKKYNNAIPESPAVKAGDIIVEVNGIREDVNKMLAEMKKNGVMNLKMQREPIEEPPADAQQAHIRSSDKASSMPELLPTGVFSSRSMKNSGIAPEHQSDLISQEVQELEGLLRLSEERIGLLEDLEKTALSGHQPSDARTHRLLEELPLVSEVAGDEDRMPIAAAEDYMVQKAALPQAGEVALIEFVPLFKPLGDSKGRKRTTSVADAPSALLVAAETTGMIRVYLPSGELVLTFESGNKGKITHLAVSPLYEQLLVAIGDAEGVIRLHKLKVTDLPFSSEPTVVRHANVEVRYLPKKVQGSVVLRQDGPSSWKADNTRLKARSRGLGYRYSRDSDDKDTLRRLVWGASVKGIDEGDGWIQVDLEASGRCSMTGDGSWSQNDGKQNDGLANGEEDCALTCQYRSGCLAWTLSCTSSNQELTFEPGPSGLVISKPDGRVLSVDDESTGFELGVQPGWVIKRVDGDRFPAHLRMDLPESGIWTVEDKTVVNFEVPPGENCSGTCWTYTKAGELDRTKQKGVLHRSGVCQDQPPAEHYSKYMGSRWNVSASLQREVQMPLDSKGQDADITALAIVSFHDKKYLVAGDKEGKVSVWGKNGKYQGKVDTNVLSGSGIEGFYVHAGYLLFRAGLEWGYIDLERMDVSHVECPEFYGRVRAAVIDSQHASRVLVADDNGSVWIFSVRGRKYCKVERRFPKRSTEGITDIATIQGYVLGFERDLTTGVPSSVIALNISYPEVTRKNDPLQAPSAVVWRKSGGPLRSWAVHRRSQQGDYLATLSADGRSVMIYELLMRPPPPPPFDWVAYLRIPVTVLTVVVILVVVIWKNRKRLCKTKKQKEEEKKKKEEERKERQKKKKEEEKELYADKGGKSDKSETT